MARRNLHRYDASARTIRTVVEALEAYASTGLLPWRDSLAPLPLPRNVAEGEVYKGANVLALWSATLLAGHGEHEWGTRAQWAKRGRVILPGEKPATCLTPGLRRPATSRQLKLADWDDADFPPARAVSVFNATQTEGYAPPERPPLPRLDRFTKARELFQNLGPCTSSAHVPLDMPEADQVAELSKSAVGRLIIGRGLEKRFGNTAEGLAVEIGAALLCASLGIEFAGDELSPEDARSWARLLVSDSTALFVIAGHAQRAADSLHVLYPVHSPRTAGPRHSTLQTAKNNEKYVLSRSPTP